MVKYGQKGAITINNAMFINGMSYLSPVWTSFQPVPSAASAPGQPEAYGFPNQKTQAAARQPDLDTYECQTRKNRKYQDGSNDPSVSFKTPTKLSPERAAYAVRAHEAEHVAHAWAQAQREDKEVVSQSVTYHTDICPECGRTYISGGNTQTTFRSAPETYEKEAPKKGANIDICA